jgi:hypothetical protein
VKEKFKLEDLMGLKLEMPTVAKVNKNNQFISTMFN